MGRAIGSAPARGSSTLGKRVATAVFLLVCFLGALFWLPEPAWGGVLALAAFGGAREWARLCRLSGRGATIYALASTAACGGLLWAASGAGNAGLIQAAYWLAVAFWTLLVPPLLAGRLRLGAQSRKCVAGWIVLLPAVAAMFEIRSADPWLLLGFMATVWISDTAAFFAGRRFGRHKLAPAVSPGKTWEGVAGASLAVAVYGFAWGYWGLGKSHPASLAAFVLLLLVLVAFGILGDLFESAMKREAGVKDSGSVLPGHGGILDRIDALTSTLPIAAHVTRFL